MVSRDGYNVFIAAYMMASRRHGTIYTGVTSKLLSRIYEHREGLIAGFTKDYRVKRLVWYEPHESMLAAIKREKSIKKYEREWKINPIERDNPYWDDLYPTFIGMHSPRQVAKIAVMGGQDKPGHDEEC